MEREMLRRAWSTHLNVAGIALAVSAFIASPRQATAQMKVPDQFENLQVLPKDIPKADLVRIMKEFTNALGVRCERCHVEAGGEDAFKFAADDKESKKTARIMMQMVQDINAKWMVKVPREDSDEGEHHPGKEHGESGGKRGDKDAAKSTSEHPESGAEPSSAAADASAHEPADSAEKPAAADAAKPAADSARADTQGSEMRVRCVTCHHGLSEPTTIDDEMGEMMASDGLPAAIEKYRQLRKKYYGGFQYDFTDRPLNRMAQKMLDNGKPDDALAILQLNAEMNPDSGMVHFLQGEAYSAQGDKAKAIKSYKKALELMPKLGQAKEKLDALEKGK
jgi:hypothetical protein